MPATHTPNLNLNKPDRQDLVSVVTDINDNMDTIDGAIGALPSGHTIQGQINTLKPVSIVLNPVTNANGATTVVTQDSRINEGLKAVYIEVGTPETFLAPIRITTGEGQIELYCANAVGSSTVTVVVEMATVTDSADPQPASVTSTEFDILANRIGTLSQLTTTQKTNVVGAINEINGKLTKQSFTLTPPSGWTMTYNNCYVYGNLVVISGLFTTTTAQSAKLFDMGNCIPYEYRSPYRFGFAGFNNATDNSLHGIVNGQSISFYRPQTENLTAIEFSATYII